MQQEPGTGNLDNTDRIESLLRESTALADIIAESNPGTLDLRTLPTLGASLRSNLRELTDLFRCHYPKRKQQ